jgi:YD repeat-containing protein
LYQQTPFELIDYTSTVTTTAVNLTTTNTYDTAGMLRGVQKADGSTLTYGYDAADGLTSVTDLFGKSIVYTLGCPRRQTVERL